MDTEQKSYHAAMKRLGSILTVYAGCMSYRIRNDVYLHVKADVLPVQFDAFMVNELLRFSSTVVNLPEVKQRTHRQRAVAMANYIADNPGYGRFAVTEPGFGCRVQWHMQIPAVIIESADADVGMILRPAIEELRSGFIRFLRLFESTETYVSEVFDYDDTRPTGRA